MNAATDKTRTDRELMKAAIKLQRRIVWLDWLRLLALFMVIMVHCCDPVLFNPDPNFKAEPGAGFWGAIWQASLRPCVPIFACLTGALLLPMKNISMGAFYKKRLGRVVWPFLIWSILYCLFPFIVMNMGGTATTVQSFFVSATEPSASLADALSNIATIPLRFAVYNLHMWYVFLIIGLYLYLPIFSAWVERATMHQKLGFLVLWALSLCLPYATHISPQLLGQCDWNSFGMLYYFAGFSGYMLLGHVIATMPEWSWKRTLAIALPTWILGYLGTLVGYRIVQTGAEGNIGERILTALAPLKPNLPYEPLQELPLLFCSINVGLMVIGLLLIFRKFNTTSSLKIRALLANLTACGFGIYLIHYFFVGPANMLTTAIGIPMQLQIPAAACIAFPCAWLVVALLRKRIPGTWFLG